MFARRGIAWKAPGVSTVAYLRDLGVLGPRTLLVHGTEVSAGDHAIVSDTGTAWAHCPKSNAKLGNGIAALGLLRHGAPRREARVGLGSDSVASNNTMDLFEEARFAVLLQRARRRSFDAMTAADALDMATRGGARALGMDGEVGALEPGRQADLIAVRLDSLPALPCYDPTQALVYAASARDVAMTMIAGDVLYQDGRFTRAQDAVHRARVALGEAACKMRDWTPPA
jgi:5-methylthioadenosine/S-adenosylhomocysteine deaminase